MNRPARRVVSINWDKSLLRELDHFVKTSPDIVAAMGRSSVVNVAVREYLKRHVPPLKRVSI